MEKGEKSQLQRAAAKGTTARLEEELKAAIARADSAQEDMQALAYTVSHDLRAPLRAIEGFSKIILEDFSAQLPEDGKKFLGHIVTNAQVLSSQIESLLIFYRLGKTPPNLVDMDLRESIQAAWEEIQAREPNRKMVLNLGELPVFRGDVNLLRQVISHLLSNAAKFTSRREEALIEVGSKPAEKETVFYVRDNGVGFDQQYVPKLFQVFQRLHAQGTFPGNGIGLAIVRRIVEAHRGRVWAEGVSGVGATFYFALPK